MSERFFQGFAAVAFVTAIVVSGSFRLRARRLGGALPVHPDGQVSPILRLALGLLVLGVVVGPTITPDAFGWATYSSPNALRWLGVGCLGVAVGALWWTLASIGTNISETVSTRQGATLVTHGPYRWIRHPLYSFGFLAIAGLALTLANLVLFLLLALVVGWLPGRVRQEEANLAGSYGQQYRDYQRTTGRFLPRIGGVIGLLAVAILGATTEADAQVLEVRVQGEGRPIVGAFVRLDSLVRRTDRIGVVRAPLASGRHSVIVGRVGWVPDTLIVEMPDRDTSIAVELTAIPTQVEELVVSTSRISRRVEDQPLRVEVLDLEEIEEKQLMTPGDIVMLLNETGGVRAQTTNPSLGGVGIRIRGLKGRYTQILADGLPLFGEQIGGLGPLQIPPIDLGQVEVVKGTASALFGGSALGGVVNLLSREPASGGTLLVNGTSLGGGDAVTFVGTQLADHWSATFLAGLHGQTAQDQDVDGWREVPGYRRAVVRPRVFWRDGDGQSLLLTAGLTIEGRDGGTSPGRLVPDGSPFMERLGTTRADVGLVGRWKTGDEGPWVQVRASGTSLAHRHRFGGPDEPDRHHSALAEVAATSRVGSLDWLLGAAIAIDRYRSERFSSVDYDHAVPGLFGQAERDFGRVSLAASARVDRHNRFGTYLSPRLSGLVRLGIGWSLRASVGAGFFAPTVLIEEVERVGLARVVPPTGLRAERATSGSLDLAGTVGDLELNASVFGSRVRHPVGIRTPAGLGLIEVINLATPTTASGVDLSIRYRRGPLGVSGSYTLVNTRELNPDLGSRAASPLTPRHAAGLVAVYESERGRIGVEFYYTGEQLLDRNPYRARSAPFGVVGLLGERRLGPLSVFVNAENITNVRQSDFHPLLLPSRGDDGRWTTDAWAPLDGRVLNGGVRWSW